MYPYGSRKAITRPGGATTNIVPDNALRLSSFTQDLASTANDLTNSFTYNPSSQVVTLTQSNTQYNYTQAQNRVGGYGVNGLNQYTQIDGESLQHNTNGNLTQDRAPDGQLIQYTYDMENHLVAATGPVASTLTYDTLGRLSRLMLLNGTTQFLYDGDALVAEYLDGTLTRRYVHGDQVDEPLVQYNGTDLATRRYLHADHQGSVIAHSDGTGAATQKNAYDPYGIPASSNSGRFGYTGQTWIPELGLNYYKARIYSPRLGRFLQTDPIFYKDDFNLYAYVGNDPTNKIDPSGTEDEASREVKRKGTSTLRRIWENFTGGKWPKDPATGWNQDVAHKKAVADGGAPNDPENLEPKTRKDHMDDHKKNGDFKRWGARAQTNRVNTPTPGTTPPKSSPGGGATGRALGVVGIVTAIPGIYEAAKAQQAQPEMGAGEFGLRALGMWDYAVQEGLISGLYVVPNETDGT